MVFKKGSKQISKSYWKKCLDLLHVSLHVMLINDHSITLCTDYWAKQLEFGALD